MKKALKIIGIIAAVIAVLVGLVLVMTAGLTRSADAFLDAIARDDLAAAYESTAYLFRESTDFDAFTAFVDEAQLAEVTDHFWSSRRISGAEGELQGTFTLENRGVVPVRIKFVKEQGEWKILYVNVR